METDKTDETPVARPLKRLLAFREPALLSSPAMPNPENPLESELGKLRKLASKLFYQRLGLLGTLVEFFKGEYRGVTQGFASMLVFGAICAICAFLIGRCTGPKKAGSHTLLDSPIVSATATALVVLENAAPNQMGEGRNMGAGASIGMGRDRAPYLTAFTSDNDRKPLGEHREEFRFVMPAPADSPSMGKPVRILADANRIEIVLTDTVFSKDSLVSGQIVWTINNTVAIKFEIPKQQPTADNRIIITDLKSGLRPLKK